MERKKQLQELYKKIGRSDPEWISDYQFLYDFPIGHKFTEREIAEIVDELSDYEFNFESLQKVISFEQDIQKEFLIIQSQINDNLNNDGNHDVLYNLFIHFEDIIESIKLSYVTINDYQYFLNQFELIRDKIKHKKFMDAVDSEWVAFEKWRKIKTGDNNI